MTPLINYDSSEGEQWGRYNLPRCYDVSPGISDTNLTASSSVHQGAKVKTKPKKKTWCRMLGFHGDSQWVYDHPQIH